MAISIYCVDLITVTGAGYTYSHSIVYITVYSKGPAVALCVYTLVNNTGQQLLAGPAVRFNKMKTIREYINLVENNIEERVTIDPETGKTTPSFADQMRVKPMEPAGDSDLGDGFTKTTVDIMGERLPAVLDTQSQTYILLNRRGNGSAVIRSMAKYITKQGDRVDAVNSVGPATKAAMDRAGLR